MHMPDEAASTIVHGGDEAVVVPGYFVYYDRMKWGDIPEDAFTRSLLVPTNEGEELFRFI